MATVVVPGLLPGVKYAIRVRATAADVKSGWSRRLVYETVAADPLGVYTQFYRNSATLATDGATTSVTLTHTPINFSITVFVQYGGAGFALVPLAAAEWSLSGTTLTLDDYSSLLAGDVIYVNYSYRGDSV